MVGFQAGEPIGYAYGAPLVDTEHPRVQALYESWSYRKVGEQWPFEDASLCAVMIRQLQHAQAAA